MNKPGKSGPPFQVAEVIERLEALVGKEHISKDYVRFRIELLRLQVGVRDKAAGSAASRATAGKEPPTVEPESILMDRSLLVSLFESIRSAVAKGGRQSAEFDRLGKAVREEPALLEELTRKVAFGPEPEYLESLTARLGVSSDALVFVGRVLVAPFIASYASPIEEQDEPSPEEPAKGGSGCCPVCGSSPGLAVLEGEEGRRVLCCSLCGHRWRFPRLICPFCEREGEPSLGKLTLTDESPRWIEVCEECKGYLKTVDRRRLPVDEKVIPLVEETATLHLDLLAEKEGYLRKLPYAALT